MSSKAAKLEKQKRSRKKEKVKAVNPMVSLAKIPHILILLAYIFFVTFTPNWMALDTNAPKFMSLAILNLLAFVYLLSSKEFKVGTGTMLRFFSTNTGLVYTGFLVMSIAVVHPGHQHQRVHTELRQDFSVFSAAYIISAILMQDMRLVSVDCICGNRHTAV
jgi:putative inorganic carbon (hco3(-)) transporter